MLNSNFEGFPNPKLNFAVFKVENPVCKAGS